MSFTIWMGQHGAAAEEFVTAEQAYRGYRDLAARGARYLQIMEGDREIAFEELAARIGPVTQEQSP
jgi:hypothetical protein